MVSFLQRSRQFFIALVLILLLGITVACAPTAQSDQAGSRAIASGDYLSSIGAGGYHRRAKLWGLGGSNQSGADSGCLCPG